MFNYGEYYIITENVTHVAADSDATKLDSLSSHEKAISCIWHRDTCILAKASDLYWCISYAI